MRRAGGEILGWDEEDFVPVDVPGGELYDTINIPKSILEADAFISVPKLKTHCQTEITVGMKSMQGVFSVEDKVNYHNEAFPWKMVDILRVAKPHLTIVDGLICGEGYGPIYTDPVEMNIVVASEDVVAIDAVCSAVMGIEPFEVPITRLGHSEGIGIGDLDSHRCQGRVDRFGDEVLQAIGDLESDRGQLTGSGSSPAEPAGSVWPRSELRSNDSATKASWTTWKRSASIVGHNAPLPRKEYKNVYIIGDCAKDADIEGTFIGGCPPLPSIQIARAFEKHAKDE